MKKIWKRPNQKSTKVRDAKIFRKNFGTEFTFIRSHYQNFNTGRYTIWRKVILSKTIYGFYGFVLFEWFFRINNIPLTDVDYFVFSDAASFVRQGLSPYLRSVRNHFIMCSLEKRVKIARIFQANTRNQADSTKTLVNS